MSAEQQQIFPIALSFHKSSYCRQTRVMRPQASRGLSKNSDTFVCNP